MKVWRELDKPGIKAILDMGESERIVKVLKPPLCAELKGRGKLSVANARELFYKVTASPAVGVSSTLPCCCCSLCCPGLPQPAAAGRRLAGEGARHGRRSAKHLG